MVNNLGNCRKELGLTQEQFSKKYKVKRSTLSCWETNHADIPLEQLIRLSNLLGFSIDYILGLRNININYKDIVDIDMDILCKNLKDLRLKHKLTQKDMANIMSIATNSYARYERGESTITSLSLYSVCKKFNVSMDELLGRTRK